MNKIQKDGSQGAESKGDKACTWTSRRPVGMHVIKFTCDAMGVVGLKGLGDALLIHLVSPGVLRLSVAYFVNL